MNILILSTSPNGVSTKRLVVAAQKRGHKIIVLSYLDMYLWFNNTGGHHHVYLNGKRLHRGEFDVIIPRIGKELVYGVEILEAFIKYLQIPSIVTPEALSLASNKWRTFLRLIQQGIKVPKTTKIHRKPYDLPQLVKWLGGYPIILKGETGSQGKGVMILETETTAKMVIESMVNEGSQFTLQQFVNTSKTKRKRDIRVWVIGGKVIGAYTRYSDDGGDPRTNYTINQLGEPVELTDYEKNIAIKTAQVIGLQVAAIDLARCIETAKTYVYEVNGNGSLKGFSKVTNIPLANHIIDYAEKVAKGIVNTALQLPSFTENVGTYFEDIGEGNTEVVACRIPPTAKQYLEDFAEAHGYESISACMKALLYNGSSYFTHNEQLQEQLEQLKGRLEKQQTINYTQREQLEELSKRQSQSIYIGDQYNQFEELTTELQSEFGESLPLLLAKYYADNSTGFFMPKLKEYIS